MSYRYPMEEFDEYLEGYGDRCRRPGCVTPRPPYRPGRCQYNPATVRAAVEPIVDHGMRELRFGVPVRHVLEETAAGGYLVGRGCSPREAIEAVERWEQEYRWPEY